MEAFKHDYDSGSSMAVASNLEEGSNNRSHNGGGSEINLLIENMKTSSSPNASSTVLLTGGGGSSYVLQAGGDSRTAVELYAAVICIIFLFSVAVAGLVSNLSVLVASKMKKSVRNLQYGLHYGLSGVNVAFCAVWMPLHTAQIVTNFAGNGLHFVVCFVNVVVFNACLAAVVFLVFFISIQRLYQLSALPLQNLRQVVVRGIAVALGMAVVAATALAIEFPWNIDYVVCTAATADNGRIGNLWFSVAAILFTLIYAIVLVVTVVILWIATFAMKQKIKLLVNKTDPNYQFDTRAGLESSIEGLSETDASHGKSLYSLSTDQRGGGREGMSSSGAEREDVSADEQQPATSSSQPHEAEQTTASDDAEDDDLFDMKMRMRLQKQSSGRRHTVANIGIGDSTYGSGRRRGSLEDSNRPNANYNYIRKWSVDIVALQDQLENPKTYNADVRKEKKKLKEKKASEEQQQHHITEDSIAENDEETDGESRREDADTERSCAAETAAPLTSDAEIEEATADECDPLQRAGEEEAGAAITKENSFVPNGNRTHASRVDFIDNGDFSGRNTEVILEKYRYEVVKTNKCILLQLVTLLCLLPYTVIQLLQPVMEPHINRNLCTVSMSGCLIMCSLQPVILVWMDSRLHQAVQRLKFTATNWKCVCYCNIGKGKHCLKRPRDYRKAGNSNIT